MRQFGMRPGMESEPPPRTGMSNGLPLRPGMGIGSSHARPARGTASTKQEEDAMPTARASSTPAVTAPRAPRSATVEDEVDAAAQPAGNDQEKPNKSGAPKASTEGAHAQTDTATDAGFTTQNSRADDLFIKGMVESMAQALTTTTRDQFKDFREIIDAHLVIARAMHRQELAEMSKKLVSVHFPKLFEEMKQHLGEIVQDIIEGMSTELKASWHGDVKAEVRAAVKAFIWADIKKPHKEIKALEDRLNELEGRVIELTNENAVLKHERGDVNTIGGPTQDDITLRRPLDQMMRDNTALRFRIETLESMNAASRPEMQQELSALQETVSELLRYSRSEMMASQQG